MVIWPFKVVAKRASVQYSTFYGIWNLSSDEGNLGTLIATNVRVIWYADINETFNISLPHMQIASVSESEYQ